MSGSNGCQSCSSVSAAESSQGVPSKASSGNNSISLMKRPSSIRRKAVKTRRSSTPWSGSPPFSLAFYFHHGDFVKYRKTKKFLTASFS
jgi:hypothetical protein